MVAETVSCVLFVPVDVVKERLQVQRRPGHTPQVPQARPGAWSHTDHHHAHAAPGVGQKFSIFETPRTKPPRPFYSKSERHPFNQAVSLILASARGWEASP